MLVLVFIMAARVVVISIAVLMRTRARAFDIPVVAAGYLHLMEWAVFMTMLVVAVIAFIVAVFVMVAFDAGRVNAHLL